MPCEACLAVMALQLGQTSVAKEMRRLRSSPIQRAVFVDEVANRHGDQSRLTGVVQTIRTPTSVRVLVWLWEKSARGKSIREAGKRACRSQQPSQSSGELNRGKAASDISGSIRPALSVSIATLPMQRQERPGESASSTLTLCIPCSTVMRSCKDSPS